MTDQKPEYHGKTTALGEICVSANGGNRMERVWDVMNRRLVNLHARMIKRVNILKAHVAQLEKMNGQRATTIAYLKSDKRTLEYNLKEARIAVERKNEEIDLALGVIKDQKDELDALKLELQDAMQRVE